MFLTVKIAPALISNIRFEPPPEMIACFPFRASDPVIKVFEWTCVPGVLYEPPKSPVPILMVSSTSSSAGLACSVTFIKTLNLIFCWPTAVCNAFLTVVHCVGFTTSFSTSLMFEKLFWGTDVVVAGKRNV